uniref:Uncharacterized protein n=1 Tax=Taeniopygia guttata TaxID=59729 RepID=A0A674GQZ6_TAEGU
LLEMGENIESRGNREKSSEEGFQSSAPSTTPISQNGKLFPCPEKYLLIRSQEFQPDQKNRVTLTVKAILEVTSSTSDCSTERLCLFLKLSRNLHFLSCLEFLCI